MAEPPEPDLEPPSAVWALTPEESVAALDGTPEGLSGDEAARRLSRFGPNVLEEEKAAGPAVILLRQFRSPLIYILFLAGAVTVALAEYVDALVIGLVLVLNATIGFVQESQAERSLEALRRLASTRAKVLRSGRELEVDADVVVPGDVLLLEAGAKVPADCRLLTTSSLEVDESLLTGESVTASKTTDAVEPEAQAADRTGMVFMGTVVTRGLGRAVVTATGGRTELGHVAGTVQAIERSQTPLQLRMARFIRLIGLLVFALVGFGFTLGMIQGEDASELFRAMVALAVAALPEGLPVVLTVTLAISVKRMAKKGAIVRRLPAVETLGSCSVIGSDKTGTLTENRMTVEEIRAGGRTYGLTGTGYDTNGEILSDGQPLVPEAGTPLELALRAGVLASEATLTEGDDGPSASGDPTEIALLAAAAKGGLFRDDLVSRYPRSAGIPFDSERRFAASFNREGDRTAVYVKGAPERLLGMCEEVAGPGKLDREAILREAASMAESGLRVLAMARGELDRGAPPATAEQPGGLTFLGLQGMMDPPRAEALEAVADCRRAGIRTVMITGDHATTALAIGRQLGIASEDDVAVTGAELDDLDDEALQAMVREVPVFARASPDHKLRLVRALQEIGEVVAVTGDGVNDSPALKQADIGAAMGRSGTDAAKEASDMVITDDNFATVFAAVGEGRVAFENVRKTTFFLNAGHAGAVLVVLISLGAGFALPLIAVQLLWLNLVTNGVQDVALAFEPGEEHLTDRPPIPREEGIISRVLWERTVIVAAVMAAGTLFMFQRALDQSGLEEARTVALTTMVVFQAFNVGNSRSETLSAFAKSPFSNRFLILGTVTALAIHVGALYFPVTQAGLSLEPIGLSTWFEIVAVASSVIVVVEAHKRLRRPSRAGSTPRAQREAVR